MDKAKNIKGAGRKPGSFKYLSPITKKPVPIHVYKCEVRALRRQSLSAKANNNYISKFTSHKLETLIKIRDAIENLIGGEFQSMQILNKKETQVR